MAGSTCILVEAESFDNSFHEYTDALHGGWPGFVEQGDTNEMGFLSGIAEVIYLPCRVLKFLDPC